LSFGKKSLVFVEIAKQRLLTCQLVVSLGQERQLPMIDVDLILE
jgi:hypothetical protein